MNSTKKNNLYTENDYRTYLEHSWGKKPEQKAREKEYNHEYYLRNKDRNNYDDTQHAYLQVLLKYNKTPIAKLEKASNKVNSVARDVRDAGEAILQVPRNVVDDVDYLLWTINRKKK